MDFVVSFLMGWLEGPVMFAQDLGWFFFAAFGAPLLIVGIIQGYAPGNIGKLNRMSQVAFLLLWVSMLLVYDFNPSWQKEMMVVSVACWIIAIGKLMHILYRIFRDDEEDEYVAS